MPLLTAMVLVKELTDESLQSIQLDISCDDNVADFGIFLVQGSFVGRFEVHQCAQLSQLDCKQVEDDVEDQYHKKYPAWLLCWDNIAITNGSDGDYSDIEGREVL